MSWIKNGYAPWRAQIDGHYGTLSAFEDVSTIRLQLETAKLEQERLAAFFAEIERLRENGPSIMLKDDEPIMISFREDEAALVTAVAELEEWLTDRELAPSLEQQVAFREEMLRKIEGDQT